MSYYISKDGKPVKIAAALTDTPRPVDVGFYLVRRVRNGPMIPLRVLTSRVGGMLFELGGEPVEMAHVPWPPARAVDEAEYHHYLKLRDWLATQGQHDRAPLDAAKLPPLVKRGHR